MKERCFRYMPLLCIVVCAVVFLAVFAVMGRAVGIPYFVGGGIFGWYVRKWMQTKRKYKKPPLMLGRYKKCIIKHEGR